MKPFGYWKCRDGALAKVFYLAERPNDAGSVLFGVRIAKNGSALETSWGANGLFFSDLGRPHPEDLLQFCGQDQDAHLGAPEEDE